MHSAGSLVLFLLIRHFDSSHPVRPFPDKPNKKFKVPVKCVLYLLLVLHILIFVMTVLSLHGTQTICCCFSLVITIKISQVRNKKLKDCKCQNKVTVYYLQLSTSSPEDASFHPSAIDQCRLNSSWWPAIRTTQATFVSYFSLLLINTGSSGQSYLNALYYTIWSCWNLFTFTYVTVILIISFFVHIFVSFGLAKPLWSVCSINYR